MICETEEFNYNNDEDMDNNEANANMIYLTTENDIIDELKGGSKTPETPTNELGQITNKLKQIHKIIYKEKEYPNEEYKSENENSSENTDKYIQIVNIQKK